MPRLGGRACRRACGPARPRPRLLLSRLLQAHKANLLPLRSYSPLLPPPACHSSKRSSPGTGAQSGGGDGSGAGRSHPAWLCGEAWVGRGAMTIWSCPGRVFKAEHGAMGKGQLSCSSACSSLTHLPPKPHKQASPPN